MQRLCLKFAILSVSLLLTSAYAVSICIPVFTEQFTGYSASSIEMLITIPAFSVMVMMLLSDFIASKLGKKRTVMLGLIIVCASVFLSLAATSYPMMLISRIVLGIGLGLCNALAVSLIADFFTGNECATMMGVRNAFEGLGQSLLTYVAGLLFVTGWSNAFYVYFAALPILVIFALFVPSVTPEGGAPAPAEEKAESRGERRLPWHALPQCLILMFTVLVSVGFYVKLFDVIGEKSLNADPEYVNNLFTALAFCSMAGGCAFGFLYARMKFYSLQLGLIATALSCLLLAFSPSMTVLTIACVLNGLAYPIIISYMFNMIGRLSVNASTVMVTSFMLIGCNVGALVTPWGFSLMSTLSGGGSAALCFIICGVIFLALALLAMVRRASFTCD